jgi:hypothetical protein
MTTESVAMATFHLPARRLILAGGFSVAVALAPAVAVYTGPAPTVGSPLACPAGETEDPFTYACAPELVPNSPTVGAPSEQQLTECSGRDQGECLEGQLYNPPPVPKPDTSVQQSP